MRRRLAAALAVLLLAPATARAGDRSDPVVFGDDAPTRQPDLAWEVPLRCTSGSCSVSIAGDIAVVVAGGKPSEVTAIDVRDGHELWRRTLAASVDQAVVIGQLVVVLGPAGAVVLDTATGATKATVDAAITRVVRAGVLLADDGSTVSAIDASSGKLLWTRRDAVRLIGACRGVVLLAGRDSESGIEAVDQRTGASRWRSTHRLAPDVGGVLCNLAWLYVANGSSVAELDLATGFRNWQTPIDGLHSFELLDHTTGIAIGTDGAVGIDLWGGMVLWRKPTDGIGISVSGPAWLRTDGTQVFKLLPWSGDASPSVDPFAAIDATGSPTSNEAPLFTVIHTSGSRVLLRRGTTVVALGLSDLGLSWSLELPAAPQWTGVAAGGLLVLDDDSLDGYRPTPLSLE